MAGGVIKPWESTLNQVVGNAPRPASFKGAGAFYQPGNADGLESLAKGLGGLGNTLFKIGIQDRRASRELALIQDVKGVQKEWEAASFGFMSNNKGQFALGADQFAQDFFRDRIGALNKKWGADDLEAQTYLTAHLEPLAISGLRTMREYGHKSLNEWEDSVASGNLADFSHLASDPAANPDEIAASFFNDVQPLMASRAQRRGLDPRAYAYEAEEILHGGIKSNLFAKLDGLIASGDGEAFDMVLDGASRAMNFGGASGGGGGGISVPKEAAPYMDMVMGASNQYGVPPEIILSVMKTESSFRPGAVSQTGVRGLMQVTQDTYKGLGFTGDRSDPENSIMAGTKLLRQNYERYGNWDDALAAYNGGHGAVAGLRGGQWGRISEAKRREVANYAPAVMRNMRLMFGAGAGAAGGGAMSDAAASGNAEAPADEPETMIGIDEFDDETPSLRRDNYNGLNDMASDVARFLTPAEQNQFRAKWDQARKERMSAYKDSARALLADVDVHKAAIARDGVGLIDFDSRLQTLERAGAIKPEQAAALRLDVGISHDVYNSIQNNGFAGARAEIDSKYNPGEYQPGTMTRERARDEMAHAQALKMVDEEYARFMAQPLDYVGPAMEREFSVIQKAGTIPDGREAVTKIEIGRRLAAEKGGLSSAQAMLLPVLTTKEDALLTRAWQGADMDGKRQIMAGITETYGKYASQVLAQSEIGPGAQVVMGIAGTDRKSRMVQEIALQTDGLNMADIKKSMDVNDVKTVDAEVVNAFNDTETVLGLLSARFNYSADPVVANQKAAMQESLTKISLELVKRGVSTDDAVEYATSAINNGYGVINDVELAQVSFPNTVDARFLEEGMRAINRRMGAAWDNLQAIFIDAGDGQGVFLDTVDGVTQYFTYDQLVTVGKPGVGDNFGVPQYRHGTARYVKDLRAASSDDRARELLDSLSHNPESIGVQADGNNGGE